MDTKDLKPGRELDALVAEKVMGWVRAPVLNMTNISAWFEKGIRGRSPRFIVRTDAPRYSIEIQAAWEVANKASGLIHVAEMTNGWVVTIRNSETHKTWQAAADTLPLAICRVALAATEDPCE